MKEKTKHYRTNKPTVHTESKEYAVYKGDNLLVMGSLAECAKELDVKENTIKFYTTPSYQTRRAKAKNPHNMITVEMVDDDDDEEI